MATQGPPPSARIRLYKPAEEKPVRFMIGLAHMEYLAHANNRAYFHPVTLFVWIAVSCGFAHYLNAWPDPSHGFWGYLQILPAFFAPAVPIMFFIDWKNRPAIEALAESTLRRIDLLDIVPYYARSPASGLWIFEYSGKPIGLLALDASTDALNDTPYTTKLSPAQQKQVLHGTGSSAVATIRHIFGEEAYRGAAIEDDMVQFAVRSAFEAAREVQTIRVLASPLRPWVLEALKKNGFVEGEIVQKIGVYRQPLSWWTLGRSKYEETKVVAESS
ncbi:hypothetical protein FA95DRAFT_1631671 [Auriscalpium vulgare]|uniref:Uncharacterized protein n=1 Tax=Auriscalpium vulgare TaxID=40419 RepID=A0ACB8RGS3_9AGAM|nr:hypothetical protein FA95DRAFT_1631671 [Auriscalpium vulgare]